VAAASACSLLSLGEAKDQERPYRQDHEHHKPNQEISAPCIAVFDGKVCRDRPSANALNRRDVMWLEVFTRPIDATAEVSWRRVCVITEVPERLRRPKSAS
jgi:hypothetical protein